MTSNSRTLGCAPTKRKWSKHRVSAYFVTIPQPLKQFALQQKNRLPLPFRNPFDQRKPTSVFFSHLVHVTLLISSFRGFPWACWACCSPYPGVDFHHLLDPCRVQNAHNQKPGWFSLGTKGRFYWLWILSGLWVRLFSIFSHEPVEESGKLMPKTLCLTESPAIARFLGHQPWIQPTHFSNLPFGPVL